MRVASLSPGLHLYRCGGRDKLREEGRCRMCLRPSSVRRLTRHHLVPKSWFQVNGLSFKLRDADANIVPLCRRCHDDVERDTIARGLLRKVLGAAEVAFAVQLRGEAWFERVYRPAPAVASGRCPDGRPDTPADARRTRRRR